MRLCRWLPVVYGSVQKVWCWKRKQYNKDSLYSENLVLCCIVPSEGVFTNSMPLPITITNENEQPTSISVSYLCHSNSFPNSRSAGQSAYVKLKLLLNVFMLPSISKLARRDVYFAFFLLLMVMMSFILAFMFQVMQILVLRKTRVWEWSRPAFTTRGFLTPVVWILVGMMK